MPGIRWKSMPSSCKRAETVAHRTVFWGMFNTYTATLARIHDHCSHWLAGVPHWIQTMDVLWHMK